MKPDGTALAEALDSAVLSATWQNDRLLFVLNDACTPSGDTQARDCVRVTELSTSTATAPARRKDFWIAATGADNAFGAAGYALNGEFHVAWTRLAHAPGQFPELRTAYHRPTDPANSLSAPQTVRDVGASNSPTVSYLSPRSDVAADPQAPGAAWQTAHVPEAGGAEVTNTWISRLQTGGSSYVPIDPVRVLDTRAGIGIGLSGPFTANVPRTWKVGGFKVGSDVVIPANAVAVTGNLTIYGQTVSGYASLTTTPNANPATSTLNFPAGDTRANNVTVPLSATGTLSAVYKAGPGKTTHFIFDVTG